MLQSNVINVIKVENGNLLDFYWPGGSRWKNLQLVKLWANMRQSDDDTL